MLGQGIGEGTRGDEGSTGELGLWSCKASYFELLCVGHGKDLKQASLILPIIAKVTSAWCPVLTYAHCAAVHTWGRADPSVPGLPLDRMCCSYGKLSHEPKVGMSP